MGRVLGQWCNGEDEDKIKYISLNADNLTKTLAELPRSGDI
jgi:hypothetical protein